MLAKHNNSEEDRDTALGWIARFRSDAATDDDRASFALWLAQDPAHKRAMDAMLDMWQDLASVRIMVENTSQQAPLDAANQSRHWAKAAIATAASVALAIFIWPQSAPESAGPVYYQTAVGEQHTVVLDDGSSLSLNTNSRVSVRYSEERRHIALLRGEAFFEVAKDSARPFDVDAGSARVTAIGTAFNIYRQGDTASITVAEGVVRVTELGATGNRPAATEILRANQQLKATGQGLQAATTAEASLSTAWQRGEIIAQGMTLADLVGQIERYHDTHILITDSSIAALTITGVFPLHEIEPILQALQVSLGLQVVPLGDKTLQLIRPTAAN